MILKEFLQKEIKQVLQSEFNVEANSLEIQQTRKEFSGDFTLVVFPLIRELKMKPEEAAEKIGESLIKKEFFTGFNVVKGFLNLNLSDEFYLNFLKSENPKIPSTGKTLMVEFSSPNTNKPLHLGHVRNILLGDSVSKIIEVAGNKVIRGQIINDRGIHICKSMLAWQKFGNGETPESSGLKGDHLVGKYYVEFDKQYRKQIQELISQGISEEIAKKEAPILLEAQEMLRKWEAVDEEVLDLWNKLNAWVYAGFDATYDRLGIKFDKIQYESQTYILGKDLVQKGLENGVFYKKEDGSVWIDLTEDDLDEKIVLRSDGTSVYITQDFGTAVERFESLDLDGLTYVVGNEQDYHFKVLSLILKKLGYSWAKELHHLSYGMVDLPDGKMKSREGTVVDADDLLEEMHQTAKEISAEAGKLDEYNEDEKAEIFEKIGQGALKYFILKVDPKKRILFDPKESVDFNGNTGPFVQYTYVRIQSILRKEKPKNLDLNQFEFQAIEREILIHLSDYNETINKSAKELNPSLIANYLFDLAKLFNSFYQSHSILNADSESEKNVRLHIAERTAETLKNGLQLLGIDSPEKM